MNIPYKDEINSPIENVFRYIAEPEKAMRWQKNVKGGKIIDDKPGVVGTTFTEEMEEDGKSLQMHGVITEYAENEKMRFHLVSPIHEVDVLYSLQESGHRTKIRIDTKIQWKFPMNVMSLFMGRKMENGIRGDLEKEVNQLKEICTS
jgi:uncharacterized protein YndB with AHSA1/START domain